MSDQPTTQGTIYTTSNEPKRQTSIPSARLKPAIQENKQPQNYAFDHTAIGIGYIYHVIQHQRPDDYDLYGLYRVKVRYEKQVT